MTKRILTGTFFLLPLFAPADTLIMKDGTQFRGNFNSANTTRMSFTEYGGNRRDVNLLDVQELRFGNDQQQSSGNRNDNPGAYRDRDRERDQISAGNPAMGDDLERLRQDLTAAMDNNDLRPDQRQALEDAKDTLRAASQQGRNGRPVNQRNLRLALDSIRNNADRMQRTDRDRLNDDVRRLSASMGTQQGRDY